jgi:hypothetical protein
LTSPVLVMVDDIDRLTEGEVCLVLLVSTRRFSESYFSFCSSSGRAVSRTDPTKVLNNDLETSSAAGIHSFMLRRLDSRFFDALIEYTCLLQLTMILIYIVLTGFIGHFMEGS